MGVNPVYKIKLIATENPIKGLFVNKTLKAIGHEPHNTDPTFLIVTLKDKSVTYINRMHYSRITYDKELFRIKAERMEDQSGGQVNADKISKEESG